MGEDFVQRSRVGECAFGACEGWTYDLNSSSLSAAWTSSSLVPFVTSSSSSQAKYLVSAAPSRMWHFLMPSSSVSFLMALASPIGLRISSTFSSPPRARLNAHDALVEIMNFRFEAVLFSSPLVVVSLSRDLAIAWMSSKMAS